MKYHTRAIVCVSKPDDECLRVLATTSGSVATLRAAALATGRDAAVWLQPAELPRERLALLGLPFDTARAEELVRAELMLNPRGQVLAVRLLD